MMSVPAMMGFPSAAGHQIDPKTEQSMTATQRGNAASTSPLLDINVSESCSLGKTAAQPAIENGK